ncbi:DUF1919 domain-containing protein [Lonepinella koalarum]|uniref:DUF1919 domain-containing protein n=1 Tax=Lonepinella koalarum TaxID=53417 RepID=UPI0011E4B395|nr:DUF1919 domain-containing protein [Lonepinella koalarum]TYG33770.1 DUF1919 domain-containing protein [Lonepinella koalarum]
MLKKIQNAINKLFRPHINKINQARLKKSNFSVIASNCNGALILHDLNQPFHSPFVNLYLEAEDFIRYLRNIEYYQQAELTFIYSEKNYPIGKLEDITIHFMHYATEQQAKQKWQARSQRINWNNLFIIMTDRDGCTYQHLQQFDALPFVNKVVFTHKPYPEFSSSFYIKGFEQQEQVGDLFDYEGLCGKKYYDQFDYVAWFNQQ